nr:TPA_asm: hypothetical protein [Phagogra virus]
MLNRFVDTIVSPLAASWTSVNDVENFIRMRYKEGYSWCDWYTAHRIIKTFNGIVRTASRIYFPDIMKQRQWINNRLEAACAKLRICSFDVFNNLVVVDHNVNYAYPTEDWDTRVPVWLDVTEFIANLVGPLENPQKPTYTRPSFVRVQDMVEENPREDPELADYFEWKDRRANPVIVKAGPWKAPVVEVVPMCNAFKSAVVDYHYTKMYDAVSLDVVEHKLGWAPPKNVVRRTTYIEKLVTDRQERSLLRKVYSCTPKRWHLVFNFEMTRNYRLNRNNFFVSVVDLLFSQCQFSYNVPLPKVTKQQPVVYETEGLIDNLRRSFIDSSVSAILEKIMPTIGATLGNCLSTFLLSTITIFSDVPFHVKMCQLGIITSTFISTGCNPLVVKKFKECFSTFIQSVESNLNEFRTQSDSDSLYRRFMQGVSDAMYCVFVNPKAKNTGINVSYLRIFTDAVNALRAAKSLEEMLSPVLLYIRDFFESRLCGGLEPVHFRHLNQKLPLWFEKCEEFLRYESKDGMIQAMNVKFSEYETCLRVADLINQGNEFFKLLCSMCDVPSTYMVYFNRTLSRITKLGESLNAAMVGMNGKAEPFVVYLYGTAGVGKSVLTDVIAKYLLDFEDDTYDPRKDKFQRSPGSDYWDGYNNQKLYVDDDFLQSKDVRYRTEAITTLILLGSRAPFPLNMAHLDGKGTTFFNSKIVILTSNAEASQNILEQHIESQGAFKRRINALVKVTSSEPMVNKANFDLAPLEFHVEGVDAPMKFNEFIVLLGKRRKLSIAKNRMLDESLLSLAVPADLKKLVTQGKSDDGNEPCCCCEWSGICSLGTCVVYLTRLIAASLMLRKHVITLREFVQRTRLGLCPHVESDNAYCNQILFDCSADVAIGDFFSKTLPDFNPTYVVPEVVVACLREYFGLASESSCLDCLDDKVIQTLESRGQFDAYFNGESVVLPKNYTPLKEKHLVARNLFLSLFSKICEHPIITGLVLVISTIVTIGGIVAVNRTLSRKKETDLVDSGNSRKMLSVETLLRPEKKLYPEDDTIQHKKKRVKIRHEANDDEVLNTVVTMDRSEKQLDLSKPVLHTHTCKHCPFSVVHSHYVKNVQHPIDADTFQHVCPKSRFDRASSLLEAEGCSDESHRSIMSACSRNIFLCKNVKTRASLSGFFVSGTLALVPAHLFFDSETGTRNFDVDVILDSVNYRGVTVHISECSPKLYESKDIVSFIVPNTLVQMHRNITRHFVLEDEMQSDYEDGSLFRLVELDKNKLTFESAAVRDISLCDKPIETVTNDDGANFKTVMASSCSYTAHTAKGDCGSLLILHGTIIRKLLGFHVAGGVSTCVGLSSIITADWLTTILDPESQSYKYPRFTNLSEIDTFYLDRVECVGIVPKDLRVRMVTKTKVKESLLYDEVFPHTTVPAMLSVTNGLDPLKIGIEKAFAPDYHFPQDVVSLATISVCNSINSMPSSYRKLGILSDTVAINGVDGDEFLTSMNFKTSAGYPYVLHGEKGKLWLFDGSPGTYEHKPFVAAKVAERLECARNGVAKAVVFVDTKKDERRPIEKVERGKTRIFSVAPYDFNFLVRKYFLAFICHCMVNSVRGEVSVGINPHSRDWGTMFHIAKAKGDNWMAGDYGGYDKRLPYQLCMSAMEVVHEFYNDGEENRRIRHTLALSMFSGFRMAGETCYRLHHGMPSGVPITAVFNSVVNSLIFRTCFIILARKFVADPAKLDQMQNSPMDWFAFRSYGDDHIVRVSKLVPWFNMTEISSLLGSYGIEYTSTDKHEIACDYVEEKDLSYLKRKFEMREGQIFAPLEMNSITELMNWVRVNDLTPKQALAANVECALMEMTHYRKGLWEEFYRKVRLASNKAGVELKSFTFSALLAQMRQLPRDDIVFENQSGSSEIDPSTGLVNRPIDAVNSALVGLTEFRDTDEPVTVQIKSVPSLSLQNPFEVPSYVDYLSRPLLLTSGFWRPDQSGVVFSAGFPSVLRTFPNLVTRLSAFQFARFGVRLMIRMNGSSLHYGRLAFTIRPFCNGNTLVFYDNTVSLLNFPTVSVSPSDPTTQHLEVPYLNPRPFVPIVDMLTTNPLPADSAFFDFLIHVYVPLSGPPGVAPVSYTVHFQLIDLELIGFSGKVADPGPYSNPPLFPAQNLRDLYGSNPFFTQSRKSLASKEANDKSESGCLSSTLAKISSLAGVVSAVPGLGEVAAPIGAIASFGSGLLSSLGWDRPLTTKVTEKVYQRRPNPNFGRGIDKAEMLCFDPENKVGSLFESMGSSISDLEISRIVARPGFIQRLKIASTTGMGERIGWLPVSPVATLISGPTTMTTGVVVNVLETPLSLTARSFMFWRGSIRFHCQVVSSVFHSCRIRVVYSPMYDDLDANVYRSMNLTDMISQVIDIRGDVDFEFTVPYCQPEQYRPVSTETMIGANNGCIAFFVVNPLAYPSLPIPDIYLNVWISGAEDFQLFRPSNRYLVSRVGTQFETQSVVKEEAAPLQRGSGAVLENYCFGERIDNLKELLGMSYPVMNLPNSTTVIKNVVLDPASPFMDGGGVQSFISHFRQLFAFSRGGYSFWFEAVGSLDTKEFEICMVPYDLRPSTPFSFLTNVVYPVGTNLSQPSLGSNNQLLIGYMPYDNNVSFSSNYCLGITTKRSLLALDIPPSSVIRLRLAVSDDFQLGFPIGAPSFTTKYENRYRPVAVSAALPNNGSSDST